MYLSPVPKFIEWSLGPVGVRDHLRIWVWPTMWDIYEVGGALDGMSACDEVPSVEVYYKPLYTSLDESFDCCTRGGGGVRRVEI